VSSCVFSRRAWLGVLPPLLLLASAAEAAVIDVSPGGFTVRIVSHVAAAPDQVYANLINPSRWWASDHTFSGNAANLHLDARAGGCWCESLPNGGSVQHLTVVYVDPVKALRLRGALGPFQGLGAEGAMTWSLKAAKDGTDLSVTYALGGYSKDGFEELSKAADGVLTEQVEHLRQASEKGAAAAPAHGAR